MGAEEGQTLQKPPSAMLLSLLLLLLLLLLLQSCHARPLHMSVTPLVLECQMPETFSTQ